MCSNDEFLQPGNEAAGSVVTDGPDVDVTDVLLQSPERLLLF